MISIHIYGANIGAVKRHTYEQPEGHKKTFISGYSNTVIPNIWDRSAGTFYKHLPKEYIERGQIYFGFKVDEKLLPFAIEEFGRPVLGLWLGYPSRRPPLRRLALR